MQTEDGPIPPSRQPPSREPPSGELPYHEEQLQAFGKLLSYQRGPFVEKGGWDKMPGEDTAGPLVARACADGLEVLLKQ